MRKINASAWNKLVEAVVGAEECYKSNPYPSDGPDWQARYDRYNAAGDSLGIALAALRSAMKDAEWGPNGSAFVTYRTIDGRSSAYTIQLWINRCLRATLAPNGYVTVVAPAEAKASWLKEKAIIRARELEYEERRKELARLLLEADVHEPKSIGEWTYREGQKGGYYYRGDYRDSVSAPGALKAAWNGTGEMESTLKYIDRPEVMDAEYRFGGERY